jgi:Flp pilus assembly pilin Flp
LFTRAFSMARNASSAVLERAHSEHGASMVQYAFLMALIALVVSVLVGALGSGHRGLFG